MAGGACRYSKHQILKELLVNCGVRDVHLFVPGHAAGPVVRGMHLQAQYVPAKL